MSDPFERIADEWDSPAWKSAAAAYHADREPIKAHASRIVPLNGGRVNQLTPETTESAPLIKSSKEFVAGFVPPDYLVDGLLQEAFLYSLTGATGAGKTAITLRLAATTALGIVFANRETKKRRVLYLAAENPADVRMRWIALAQQMDFDADTIAYGPALPILWCQNEACAAKRVVETYGIVSELRAIGAPARFDGCAVSPCG